MDSNNQIIIYQTEDGQTQIDVRLDNDMIWLTRQQIAVLFGRDYKTISKHINNALKEELAGSVVVAKFANTTQHGAIDRTEQLDIGAKQVYRVHRPRFRDRLSQGDGTYSNGDERTDATREGITKDARRSILGNWLQHKIEGRTV